MRKIVIIAAMALAVISCKKEEAPTVESGPSYSRSQVEGDWTGDYMIMFAPGGQYLYDTIDYSVFASFNADDSYATYYDSLRTYMYDEGIWDWKGKNKFDLDLSGEVEEMTVINVTDSTLHYEYNVEFRDGGSMYKAHEQYFLKR